MMSGSSIADYPSPGGCRW